MKILTWNINGYRSTDNKNLFKPILDEDYDIICLQEIKMNQEISNISDYYCYYNFAVKKGYSGVAVITKVKPLSIVSKIGIERFDNEGRFLLLEFENFYLINLYIPQGGREKENLDYKLISIDKIISVIKNFNEKPLIMCTDFNVAHNEIDVLRYKSNYNNIMFTLEERKKVDDLLNIGLVDCFRYKYPSLQSFSWWPNAFNCRERNIGWRIDYIFVSEKICGNVLGIMYLKNRLGSDHCPVLMELKD